MIDYNDLLIAAMRKLFHDIQDLSEDCREYTIEKVAFDGMAIWGLLEMTGNLCTRPLAEKSGPGPGVGGPVGIK